MLKSLQNLSQRFVDLCNTVVPNSHKMPTQTRSFSDITTAFSLAGSGAVENVTETVNKGRIYLKAKRNSNAEAGPESSVSKTQVEIDEEAIDFSDFGDKDLNLLELPVEKKQKTEASAPEAPTPVAAPAPVGAPMILRPIVKATDEQIKKAVKEALDAEKKPGNNKKRNRRS